MSSKRSTAVAALVLVATGAVTEIPAQSPPKRFQIDADLRFRFESDWDSQREDGSPRDDRDRMRLRARLGFRFRPVPRLTLGIRARTGPRDGQQSPHYTFYDFQGGDRGSFEGLFDRYSVRYGTDERHIRGGRDEMPFWTQNEFLWDGTVSPLGVSARYTWPTPSGAFTLNGAVLRMLDGAVNFHATLAAGQAVWRRDFGAQRLVVAGSFTRLFGEKGAVHLRNGNGARDYAIWTGNLQYRFPLGGRRLQLSADFMHNAEPYRPDDPDPFTAAHFDQKDAFDATVSWGKLETSGEWLMSYTWARIETLAVNASWAQDDWVRWGQGSQVDGSDQKGHELRGGLMILDRLSVLARFYLVKAITSVQDGKRFRLDVNYRF